MKRQESRLRIAESAQIIEKLEILVDELVKTKPREDLIRAYMQEAGLPYKADPIERINAVMEALNGLKQRNEIQRERGPRV